jgi:hypothetical protein
LGNVAIIEGEEEDEENEESPCKDNRDMSIDNVEAFEIDPDILKDTKSFFMHKGKGKYEDIQAEREWRLKKIKIERKPMNYDKLRKHEASFVQTLMENKERRREELKKRCAELEKNYQERYKSKTYTNIESNYSSDRHKILLQKEKALDSLDAKKELGTKILKSNFPALPKIPQSHLRRNSNGNPVNTLEHANYFYGRFGRNEFHKSVDLDAAPNYQINKYQQGNQFLQQSGRIKLSEEQLISIRATRQKANSEREIPAPRLQSYKTGESANYVKNSRENRRKSEILVIRKKMSQSMDLTNNPETSIKGHIRPTSRTRVRLNRDQRLALESKVSKIESMTKRKETRIRLGADSMIFKSDADVPDELDDYYLKGIKAKLSLLDSYNEVLAPMYRVGTALLK